MNCSISFTGISRAEGTKAGVEKFYESSPPLSLCGHSNKMINSDINEAVILTGKDMQDCAKDKFGIEIPDELMQCKSQEDAEKLFEKDPTIFINLAKSFQQIMKDAKRLTEKVFEYYQERKDIGVDAENNLIEEIKC